MKSFLQSSVDPTQLSNTIRGIIISLSSVIILVASVKFNVQLSQNQVVAFADQMATTVSAVGVAIGAIHALYGVMLRILNKFGK